MFYPLTAVRAEVKSCDCSHVTNCADDHTQSQASFGNDMMMVNTIVNLLIGVKSV